RLAVLEGVNDHENLGAVFRSAAALGIDGVLLSPDSCDPLYRRSVRVSQGHSFTLPYARLEPWPEGLGRLSAAGFVVAALTPRGDTDIARLDAGVPRVALVLGGEAQGLSGPALERADYSVRIPMAAGVDSLNLAAA